MHCKASELLIILHPRGEFVSPEAPELKPHEKLRWHPPKCKHRTWQKNSRSTPSGIIWHMSHTNPRADRRPLGNLQGWESTRIRRKDVLFNFHSVAKYENSGRPGARTRARRAHQFYVPRSDHYAICTWLTQDVTSYTTGLRTKRSLSHIQ